MLELKTNKKTGKIEKLVIQATQDG